MCSAPAPSLRSVLCVNRRHILYLISSIPRPTDFKKSLAYSVLRNGLYFQARTCSWSDNKYTGRCPLCLSLDKPCFPGRRLIHWRQWYLPKAWQSSLGVQLIYELVTFWKCVICCRKRLTFFCHTADSVCDLWVEWSVRSWFAVTLGDNSTKTSCDISVQSVGVLISDRSNVNAGTVNPLNAELNPICCLLTLLGAHHFLHVSRIRVKLLTFRLLMSYIWSTYSWCF